MQKLTAICKNVNLQSEDAASKNNLEHPNLKIEIDDDGWFSVLFHLPQHRIVQVFLW